MTEISTRIAYAVCNRLLDAEENLHCEFDGDVEFTDGVVAGCPACGGRLHPAPVIYEAHEDVAATVAAPSPAELEAQRRARVERENAAELARVRKRARLRTHVDDETLRALGKLTFPVKRRKGKRR